jgi:transposase
LAEVSTGSLSLSLAALKLGLSYRQMRRLRRRYEQDGDAGLVHRLRGRRSNRKSVETVRTKVLGLCRERFVGFGPTLVSEYLLELDEPVAVSHDTVRRWQLEAGLLSKERRRGKHRRRRERRSRCGELVQMDGSWHDWFEGRGAWCCLMVMIDDATGAVFARFYERETLEAAFDVFGQYAAAKGLPGGLYVDRAGIYRSDKEPTLEQELAGERPLTHFGRAMKTLEVELILANSPQAKGRVERVNGTLQDRLVKAMRLARISDIVSANGFLDSFLASFNAKFNVPAADAGDVHRVVAAELDEVLCEHHERKVGRDWCVQWRGTLLQIDKRHEPLNLPGKSVTLQDRPGATVRLSWQQQTLAWQQVKSRPPRPRPKPTIVNNQKWTPSAHHPWKAGIAERIKIASLPAPHGGPEEKTPEPHQRTILLR